MVMPDNRERRSMVIKESIVQKWTSDIFSRIENDDYSKLYSLIGGLITLPSHIYIFNKTKQYDFFFPLVLFGPLVISSIISLVIYYYNKNTAVNTNDYSKTYNKKFVQQFSRKRAFSFLVGTGISYFIESIIMPPILFLWAYYIITVTN